MNDQAQLCYVDLPFLWFTMNLREQSGDDWNDAPFEYNAEPPHLMRGQDWEIFQVAIFANPFKHQLRTPDSDYYNSPWSVDDINSGAVPWLSLTDLHCQPLTIARLMAGTTYAELKEFAACYGLLIWTSARNLTNQKGAI